MEIGVGLPTTLREARGRVIVDWARAAEEAGFSTLGTLDRLVYPSHESLLALAAAAAVTEEIRLATTILIAPLRPNAPLLAKQATTLQSLSGGRFVLGLSAGSRRDDYEVAGIDHASRGRAFDEQLEVLRSVWSGRGDEPLGRVAPDVDQPAPQLLIGGQAPPALRRVVDLADGWISGGGGPPMFRKGAEAVREAWAASGRAGRPRLVAISYFALGPDADARARSALGDYYGFLDPAVVDVVVSGAATSEPDVARTVAAFEEAGCDELILFPCAGDVHQIKLLEAVVGGG